MTSSEMHTLAGAFAVDALSEHERARFQRHLEECASCAQEVRELQATAARLGIAVAEEPPAQLKDRVMAEIRVTRQQSPGSSGGYAERSRSSARVPRWALTLVAAAAVVGLASAGVFAGVALNRQDQLVTAQSQADQIRQDFAPLAELLAAPDTKTSRAVATIGGSGTVVMSVSLNKMAFIGGQLPAPDADKDLEVWLMKPGEQPHSLGLVSAGQTGDRVISASDIQGAAQVALTVEPKGGSPSGQPTSDPVLRVFL